MNGISYPTIRVEAGQDALVSSAGARLLVQTAQVSGLAAALSEGLAGFCSDRARHDPGKVLLDLAITIAVGGDCLADLGVLRAQPQLFGAVASDPTVSRLFDALTATEQATAAALSAVRAAAASARVGVWERVDPLDGAGQVVVDLDATLIGSHSDKEGAAATYKRGFGFHPLLGLVDHGGGGTGEPLVGLLRPGNAGSATQGDHIAVLDAALAQLPAHCRSQVLVRADGAGGTKQFLAHVVALGLQYSTGITVHAGLQEALAATPRQAWRKAVDAHGAPRPNAYVAELTTWLPARFRVAWPAGMRVIARREKAHPGAQLRIGEDDGWRVTLFVTNSPGRPADLEYRHRQRARAEDRIRDLKATGADNLPLHSMAKNALWLELCLLACQLLTWTQQLAWRDHEHARVWSPKTLRFRILAVAGRIIRSGRRHTLRISDKWPWADLIRQAHHRLAAL
ncbi:MAG: IS1380 family transposase [Candidatus Nanopelagicales bacterium]